jgi:hypothetical protein
MSACQGIDTYMLDAMVDLLLEVLQLMGQGPQAHRVE